MATALFSSDGEEVINRKLDSSDQSISKSTEEALEETYEIGKTISFIQENGFQRVALQFPDELLVDSVTIARQLEDATSAKVYILGDTSYGSCCVDEVSAEHVGADAVVHYGRACLSPCTRLPVSYVFGRKAVDASLCADAFQRLFPDRETPVVIFTDVVYEHVLVHLEAQLGPNYPRAIFSKLPGQWEIPSPNETCKFGRRFSPDPKFWPDGYSFFYVGGEGPTLSNLMLTWPRCPFFSYNPETAEGRKEGLNVNRALMKRFYLIEKARDAQVVGILVGTLGVSDYLSALKHLKDLIRRAGKKSYMMSMGKLNPAKLANFPEVDVFVLVACPENSLLDSSGFYRPIVTPDEMEVACNPAREWSGHCITDFRELLPGGCAHVQFPEISPADADHTDVSLITGELRSVRLWASEVPEKEPDLTVAQRNNDGTLAELGPAASFLSARSWQGLDRSLGQTAVVKAVEGRRGIAIAYEDELES
ncbi:2-(3-amino-3-carboxypropyl)histidine synthase subunit 2 [Pelobates cultripes]|uniref:2-(3-amino-3-carboxypropyl)histidine synthase subunit 2 n=1 Tax=Pelobates cultripes TaxID=61616 RepID=A0AAD1WJY2_PELCU|nr:2-(3-amino-3-carboxypropyl)histidine synthase subunit 2 [Pelobates cultripes]